MEVFKLIIYLLYLLTVVGTIFVVVSENRNPTKTLSWVLVLVFLPAIGIVFYYVFGQNNRKKRPVNISSEDFTNEIFSDLIANGHRQEILVSKEKVLPEFQSLAHFLEKSNDSKVWYGSDVEIITVGKRKFEALLEDLENARHHIHMEYFYFKKDETGKKVKEILMKKASEGVEVRFIYENVANIAVLPKYYYEMREAGVQVLPFSKSTLPWVRRKLNYRNHRKVVVIDGNVGYMGGMNIGNEYANNWRDTHLRILGQGVYGLQANFLYDWYSSAGKKVNQNYMKYFPVCGKYSDNLMQIAPESPDSPWPYLLIATTDIVSNAKDYIYIQTPYYMPSEPLLQALQTAALKGVDVRIMVSRKSDIIFMDYATQSYYDESLKSGIRIYELQDVFSHAKTMVSDDYLSVIGSANMDFRSLELSFEINAYMYDPKIAEQNKTIFFEDMKGCKEVLLDEWRKRSFWRKFLESIMRLFSPLL